MEKRIENALITSAELTMEEHGCLTMFLYIQGDGWACAVGGYCLGHGFVGSNDFRGYSEGIEEIMRVMDVVGVSKFSKLAGQHIRVEINNFGGPINKIGNIVKDKWFDYEEFYKKDN